MSTNKILLRVSDCVRHAEEFSASSYAEFVRGLNDALDKYRARHLEWAGGAEPWQARRRALYSVPRPHLHVYFGGAWVDAGYGHGTYIRPKLTITENGAALRHMWMRCIEAHGNAEYFDAWIGGLKTWMDSQFSEQRRFMVIDGGKIKGGDESPPSTPHGGEPF